jgi:activator of HSP90 ATPase
MAIHQEITLHCKPAIVYEALIDAAEFATLTGAPAEIDPVAGGAFSGFGGQITGRNIELKPDELIVQAWRAGAWPEGTYSIVRIRLEQVGADTLLTLDQDGHPADAESHLDGGWHKMYWEPLAAHCE